MIDALMWWTGLAWWICATIVVLTRGRSLAYFPGFAWFQRYIRTRLRLKRRQQAKTLAEYDARNNWSY